LRALNAAAARSPQVANPSETYPLYVLPYCPPRDGDLEAPAAAQATLGETLAGDRRMNTPCVGRHSRARHCARARARAVADLCCSCRCAALGWPRHPRPRLRSP